MFSLCYTSALVLRALICAPATASGDSVRPTLTAIAAQQRPAIDGRLNEAIWSSGEGASRFTQVDPRDGAAPSERTVVRIAYDRDAIYVGVRLLDTQASHIVSRLSRR